MNANTIGRAYSKISLSQVTINQSVPNVLNSLRHSPSSEVHYSRLFENAVKDLAAIKGYEVTTRPAGVNSQYEHGYVGCYWSIATQH